MKLIPSSMKIDDLLMTIKDKTKYISTFKQMKDDICGFAAGCCGPRTYKLLKAKNHENYLTFTPKEKGKMSIKLNSAVVERASIGEHTIEMEVGLKNYPTAKKVKVPFKLTILDCIVTSLTPSVKPADFKWKIEPKKPAAAKAEEEPPAKKKDRLLEAVDKVIQLPTFT